MQLIDRIMHAFSGGETQAMTAQLQTYLITLGINVALKQELQCAKEASQWCSEVLVRLLLLQQCVLLMFKRQLLLM